MIAKVFRAATAAATVLSTRILLACPLCAENMAKDPYGRQPTALGRGFFWSIMLMIAAPFLTVTIVAVKLFLARRRARENQAGLNAVPENS